ncbi:MAG: hypothetical protein A4S09_13470 [Proteobacteria bacterium SG_bin7]|nr:MAG: hypothetical protein A4S09_13470 [Proteobacteria bacterium SG_bin7]
MTLAVTLLVLGISVIIFLPNEDRTFFKRTSNSQKKDNVLEQNPVSIPAHSLFISGEQKRAIEQRLEAEKKKRKNIVKYFAPQVLGTSDNRPKSILAGAKLLGFLMNPIDTREPSMVRVLLPKGGQSFGVTIEDGSVLIGQFNYSGSGEKVFLTFHRIDTANGESKKINAQGLDSRDYTIGVRGELHSEKSIKLASQIGLSLFAGMADTFTEKESMGFSQVAKPTMKNGLLQGMSRAAEDQVGQTASEIQSLKDYVLLPEGKEMIIQLSEDFRK